MTVVVRSAVTGPDPVLTEVPCTDKHGTPSSHFKPTLGQPALI